MEDITETFKKVQSQGFSKEKLARVNIDKSIRFKAGLAILIAFFLWLTLLHGLGIYFFTKGFLLTRLVLDQKSVCEFPPIEVPSHKTGCWHDQSFKRAVILIIDALRYDFTVPSPGSSHHFHNALHVLHESATQTPDRAFLLPFVADPPTTTLQRLKGLTTGTLPTFIDAGSNFAGTAIEEDNLVAQLRQAGRNIVHLGDDTWHSLFPGYFDTNLTHAYDSFNVWDLFTVDNGVTEHLLPLLAAQEENKWDVVFGHFLGVDHAGHRYGPNHPATHSKLQEMDGVIREVIDLLDETTLLVVMGDHGMDVKGDHGGESDDEVEAALWMYTKSGIFGHGHNGILAPPATAKERPVAQIDLVPTLSLLLGLPVPYNNLGSPISEAFVGPGEPNWRNLATVNALVAAQINKYQQAYSLARALDDIVFASIKEWWDNGRNLWQSIKYADESDQYEATYNIFSSYQKETLKICRSLWARFDILSMVEGITILACSLAILVFFVGSLSTAGFSSVTLCLGHMSLAGSIFFVGALCLSLSTAAHLSINAGLKGFAFGSIFGFAIAAFQLPERKRPPLPSTVLGWMAMVITLSQSVGFASNSYTIWEDEILLFFLLSFAAMGVVISFRRELAQDRFLGAVQSMAFGLLTLLASFSRLCREEQMPYCRSTYYATSTSSTSAPWQLLIPLVTATLLPLAIKYYYARTKSYEGVATVWVGFFLRIGLLCNAAFWLLDAADDNDWLSMDDSTLKIIKIVLARLIIGISLVGGASSWVYSKPCINIKVTQKYGDNVADPKSVQIYGSSNIHGTRYYLVMVPLLIGLSLLQKPMGNGALAVLALQVLSLLEILHVNNLSQNLIGPVVLGALGNFHFFKTGHQATLSSIQWESAFIPLSSIKYPFSPILVVLNSFGPQIMTATAIPLIALWRQPPKKAGLMESVATSLAVFLLYHATINMATTLWAGYLRRHLMLYRVFNPRFMTAAAVLLIVDLVGALLALVAFWYNTASIAEVFGWM